MNNSDNIRTGDNETKYFVFTNEPDSNIIEQPVILTNKSNSKLNFTTVAAKENTPQRNQAIIFDSIEGIPQIEYIKAIGKIVPSKIILFVSRITKNRFYIFLNNL